MIRAWDAPLRLHELKSGPVSIRLEPDEAARGAIARQLGLPGLPALTARLTVRPWLDGAELSGVVEATVTQVCGVTLEPFDAVVSAEIEVRAVPTGSPNAGEGEGAEINVDPDAPDPPDVLEGDALDLAHYVTEYLALEIDPFPRKPGATFEYQAPDADISPFSVLKALKDPKA